MPNSSDRGDLHSDSPLDTVDDDKLGYSNFAVHLADTIATRVPTDGFVIGIYGQWGSGKSTILEFVGEEIAEIEENERPIVVRYNPWWFSGQADLFEIFFDELAIALGEDSDLSDIRDEIHKYSKTLSNLPLDLAGIPMSPLRTLTKLTEEEETSIHEIKDDISETLAGSERPIVVMIDDMDRLTQREVSQMFQLVKSVADFPNLTYILAFDEDVIVKALEAEEGLENGQEYLEKIIQLPVRIPVPEENSFAELVETQLRDILGDQHIDENRFQVLLQNGVLPTLATPRDATRLANAVDFNFSAIRDEANFVDLVALESLRVFYQDVYEEIRDNSERFVGRQPRTTHQRNQDKDDYVDILPDSEDDHKREIVISILSVLFRK
ncbi:P-loop NTPase fold protein [Halobium palmae]|uniref:P-loop NTPase fold protein n=1 Tax=Halobium palmae TaxID=1776492 RepID=A0ABD5RV87_9EURY